MDVIFTGHLNLFTLTQRGNILEVTLKVISEHLDRCSEACFM